MTNGIECCNNQTIHISIATIPFLMNGIELLHLTNCYVR